MKHTMEARISCNNFFNGPLFLVGMPRSGTKLLRELLNRHPRICINSIETEFFPYLASQWASFGNVSDIACFQTFYANITRLPYFIYRADMGCMVDALTWHEACCDYTPAGVFEALVRLDADAPFGSDRIWGDKSPSYVNHLRLIKMLYPAARFIHIVRDVRDYCLSINKAWGKDMPRAAQRWAEGVDAARAVSAELGQDYLELHYEDLLTETDMSLRRVAAFVGVDFDPVMLTLAGPSENLGDARGATSVVARNWGKYLTAMDRGMLTQIEALAGETLTSCGYTLTQPPKSRTCLSSFAMRMAQLRDAQNLMRFEARKRGFWAALKFQLYYFLVTRRV